MITTTENLKPCPFCGGQAILRGGANGLQFYFTMCLDCHASNRGAATIDEARTLWNNRHEPKEGEHE